MLGRLPAVPFLVLLALFTGLCGVFTMPPLDRDEARYAQATAQMLESGDFVRINFQDGPRNKKPVGIHWLQTAAVNTFSDVENRAIWAYRLPSVLAFVIAVIATYIAGLRLLNKTAAFAGAAFLAVCVLAGVEAGIAKTDAALLAATTTAMAALAAFYRGAGLGSVLTFWLAVGAGVLIKGPVTPMVAGLTLLALIIIERNARWALRLVWPPFSLLLATVLTAPWFVMIWHATNGAFYMDSLGQDLGPKMVSAHETHGGPFGLHLLLVSFLIWPATLFLIPGIVQAIRSVSKKTWTRERDAMRFLLAWLVPTWLVFELLPTKLAHYTLPTYPALALMAGAAFAAWKDHATGARRTGLLATSTQLFTLAGLVLLSVVVLVAAVTDAQDLRRLSDASASEALDIIAAALSSVNPVVWALIISAAAALLFAPFALMRAPNALLGFAIGAGLLWHVVALQWAAPRQDALFVSKVISDELEGLSLHPKRSSTANPPLVVSGYSEPSLVFLTDTDTVLASGPEQAALIAAESPSRAAIIEAAQEQSFLSALDAVQAEAVRVGVVSGLNYSRGDPVQLLIFRTTRPAPPDLLELAHEALNQPRLVTRPVDTRDADG